MADGEKSGLKAVLAEEVGRMADVPGSSVAEQLPLLPLSQVTGIAEGAETSAPSGRGAGRPAGSKNKNTEEWRNYLLGRYQSPLVALAETFNRSLTQLAADLGYLTYHDNGQVCRRPTPAEMLELFKIQMQCAKELAPYVHSKQPIGIDPGDGGLMQLIIQTGVATGDQVKAAGNLDLHFIDPPPQQNQSVSDRPALNSVIDHSVIDAEPIETEGESHA